MHRRGREEGQTSKRRPPVRLGRKLCAHLARWRRIDEAARGHAQDIYDSRDHSRRTYLPPAPYINVVAYEGREIEKMRKPWYAACDLAGLADDVTPHFLRHARATRLLQAGIDMWEASGSLGMSVKILSDVYGHHHPDFQKQAAEV